MDFSVNRRIKELRKNIGLNQRDFSKLLSLSSGYISGIEVNLRKVNDRLIKLIVSEYGVNEDWLRFGNGEMYKKTNDNDKTALISSLFNNLPPHYQDVVLGLIDLLLKAKKTDRVNAQGETPA